MPLSDKAELRRLLLARRDASLDRDAATARITERILALPAWNRARVVMAYVGVKSEVGTTVLIADALAAGKIVAVPVVRPDDLLVVRLDALEELAPAPFGLREPPLALQGSDRLLPPEQIDLVLVPGVGFDRNGGRLGYGRGYYDRLLRRLRPDAASVALAFACQVVDRIPMGEGDTRVGMVVTERQVLGA